MKFSDPHRYKLYSPCYYWDGDDVYSCDIMMSSMPSKEEIIQVLAKLNKIDPSSCVSKISIERPSGWYYKTIIVLEEKRIIWKIIPASE